MCDAPRLRLQHHQRIFHAAVLHHLEQARQELRLITLLEIAHPFVGDAIALVQQDHIREMHAGIVPGQKRRVLLRQPAVHHAQHAPDLAADRREPAVKRLDLVNRVGAPIRHEKHRACALRQRRRLDLTLRQPAPAHHLAKLRVMLRRLFGVREKRRRPVRLRQPARDQVREHFAPAGTGRAEYEIHQGFFRCHVVRLLGRMRGRAARALRVNDSGF